MTDRPSHRAIPSILLAVRPSHRATANFPNLTASKMLHEKFCSHSIDHHTSSHAYASSTPTNLFVNGGGVLVVLLAKKTHFFGTATE